MIITILLNLGSPKSPSPEDVGEYLNEFLMDERVIDLPFILRWFLVKKLIVPKRKFSSAKLYEEIYTNGRFPLIDITEKQAASLEKLLKAPVLIAMRYGAPTLEEAFKTILETYPQATEVKVVPLYPHYTQSSYETAVVQVANVKKATGFKLPIKVMDTFYDDKRYIDCLVNQLKKQVDLNSVDHVLFSYHGIPVRHLKKAGNKRVHVKDELGHQQESVAKGQLQEVSQDSKGGQVTAYRDCETCPCFPDKNGICNVPCSNTDINPICYKQHVEITTEKVAKALQLTNWSLAYQSRLGKSPWLGPSTVDTLASLGKSGVKHLVMISPGFITDCLETIEELGEEAEEIFKENGGETYTRVSCLNDSPGWLEALANMCNDEALFYNLL